MQLVQFWPAGHMNIHGIRDALCRAKERKRALSKQKYKVKSLIILLMYTISTHKYNCTS